MTTPDTLTSGHQEGDVVTCDALTLLQLLRISSSPQLVKMIILVIMIMMMMVMMVRGPQTVWKCWQWARAERGWRWRGEHTGCQCQGSDIRQIKFLAPSWILFTLCPIYINIRAKAAPATPPRQFVWGTFWQFWFDYIENSGHHSPAPVPGPSLYIINLHILGWQPQCHIFSHYDTFPLKPQNKSDTFTINMTLMGRHGCSEWRQETEF